MVLKVCGLKDPENIKQVALKPDFMGFIFYPESKRFVGDDFVMPSIRFYETAYRNTLDINALPILKEKTHLLAIVDHSRGIGIREIVPIIALAAMMAGADGVIYEVHEKPEEAASVGAQTLNFDESKSLVGRLNANYSLNLV